MIKTKPTRESLKTNAYNYIKKKLLSNEYTPSSFINEKLLIQELQMSRTPIREAIIQLEQDGFLQILPKRGIIVRDITSKDIVELYEYRKMVESYAIRCKGYFYSRDKLQELKGIFNDNGNNDSNGVLDDNFHKFIYSALDNQYIINTMRSVRAQNQRARIIAYSGTRSKYDTASEHLLIIDALLENKILEAEAAMIMHLENSKNAAVKRISGDIG